MENPDQAYPLPTVAIPAIHPPLPLPIYIPTPVTYQFRVIEYVDDNKIVKVELQVQTTLHTSTGGVASSSGFTAIPRIQLPFVEYSK